MISSISARQSIAQQFHRQQEQLRQQIDSPPAKNIGQYRQSQLSADLQEQSALQYFYVVAPSFQKFFSTNVET